MKTVDLAVAVEAEEAIAEDLTDAMTEVDAIGKINVYLTNKNPAIAGFLILVAGPGSAPGLEDYAIC